MQTLVGRASLICAGAGLVTYALYKTVYEKKLLSSGTSTPTVAAKAVSEQNEAPESKAVSESAVTVTYKITPDMTDEHGRVYAGEILKIIDVIGGVAARRHAEMQCVTISLDRFILIQELRIGDIIHVYGSVNRAWGSSLETGIKVVLEDPINGSDIYCCHAYLTFVAIHPRSSNSAEPSQSIRLPGRTASNTPRPRPKLKAVKPVTMIEEKRFILAGRRREARIKSPPPKLTDLREEILHLSVHGARTPDGTLTAHSIDSLEKDILADAVQANDPTLIYFNLDGDTYVSVQDGEDPHKVGPESPVASVNELRGIIASRGSKQKLNGKIDKHGRGIRSVSQSRSRSGSVLTDASPTSPVIRPSPHFHRNGVFEPKISYLVTLEDTFACTLRMVLPQHANSAGILFGGQLMEWMESTALIAAQRLRLQDVAWVTATMDGLEFREAVAIGDVLTFRAVITRIWKSSLEVYVCSHADNPLSPSTPRFTNECFLTMVALSPATSHPIPLGVSHMVPPGTAAEKVSEAADARKRERLEMKNMLIRVYT